MNGHGKYGEGGVACVSSKKGVKNNLNKAWTTRNHETIEEGYRLLGTGGGDESRKGLEV